LQEFAEAEQTANKLDSVLRSTGGAAELSADQIKNLAAQLQRVTTFGDDATISAATLLATFTSIKGPG
jgi:hypothetical protein